jgi:membrane-bound serine protease (ClpP class)
MLGTSGRAVEDFDQLGDVFVHGERWRARTTTPLHKGDRVRVTAIDGLELDVEPDN